MADDHDIQPPGRRSNEAGLLTPDNRASRASYETGESSRSGSKRGGISARRTSVSPAGDRSGSRTLDSASLTVDKNNQDSAYRGGSIRRKLRHNTGGGFLLHDAVERKASKRVPQRESLHPNGKTSRIPRAQAPQPASLNGQRVSTDAAADVRPSIEHAAPDSHGIEGENADDDVLGDQQYEPEHDHSPPPRDTTERAADNDSTQIVQMALKVSESRRIAARRNVSRGTPPRLGPVPDGSSGSNLRQHFQQQRKSSYNSSPRLLQSSAQRRTSGKVDSPLQTSFDTALDGQYPRYHFSTSTLTRAQNAKDHLELLAQYRRLLEVLPPLKAGQGRYLTSPPGSPVANKPFRFGQDSSTSGRQYNPLQYIRNRKVRARERKVIDGERQGFGDVDSVRPWVDKVVERSTSFASLPKDDKSPMPRFPGADEINDETTSESSARATARIRRPRVDWFIEPCDIVADAYWLDQDDHKELIEDRHWRKIFPSGNVLSRPMSRESTAEPAEPIPPFAVPDDDLADPTATGIDRVDTDLSNSSARDRAKQRIQNIRALPHRHPAHAPGDHRRPQDFLWGKKASASDTSEAELDAQRAENKKPHIGKDDTITRNSKDALEKQMLEMIAREKGDRDLSDATSDVEPVGSPGIRTPERYRSSQPPSQFHSRKGSLVDASDSDRKPGFGRSLLSSPPRYLLGRQSLDGERVHESSMDERSSLPTSPELRPTPSRTEPLPSSHLLPSWSRSGSPTRNPINKIKQIIRDKSSEPELKQEDRHLSASDRGSTSPEQLGLSERKQSTPSKAVEKEHSSHDRSGSHRRSGSTRLRPDDQPASLRGMFKGPRIDTVLKGSVSKLGDIIWKRDGSGESAPELESMSESEGEKVRGRSRSSSGLSRRQSKRDTEGHTHAPKTFLDSMPQFNHVPDPNHTHPDNHSWAELNSEDSTRLGTQSTHFDTLRPPPRIDARSTSPSTSPATRKSKSGESDISESESGRVGIPVGVRGADQHLKVGRESSSKVDDDSRSHKSRHWSIADKGTPTEQAALTRREIARMRALILSSGVKAMEISRRAQEVHKPFRDAALAANGDAAPSTNCAGIGWPDIAKLCPDAGQLREKQISYCDLYPVAARSLSTAIQKSGRRWQASADYFAYRTSPQLQNRIGDVRSRIADDLSERTRQAADEADEINRDLVLGQPLKTKVVVDIIEKMLRRRRRRLRWVRRALWLTVEWLLVGFMWYVWFMVMILRVFVGVGQGIWSGVRWLLWM